MTLRRFIVPVNTELHHGLCIGVDAQAHEIIAEIQGDAGTYFGHRVIGHPGVDKDGNDKHRAQLNLDSFDHIWANRPFLERNQNIVLQSDILVAVPSHNKEILRSGTWATVRFADRVGKLVLIILTDGSIQPYPELRENS